MVEKSPEEEACGVVEESPEEEAVVWWRRVLKKKPVVWWRKILGWVVMRARDRGAVGGPAVKLAVQEMESGMEVVGAVEKNDATKSTATMRVVNAADAEK